MEKHEIVEEKIRRGEINYDVKPPQKKKTFFYYLFFIPKKILIWWVGLFFGMFGLDNPLTKEGFESLAELGRRMDSSPSSSTSQTQSTTAKYQETNATQAFMDEYISARASGGAYKIQSTHGLTQAEITTAIENAEIYLRNMGYK